MILIEPGYLTQPTRISAYSTVNGAPIDDSEENGEEKLLSYFARVNYNLDEKYLLSVTFRADGSSRFASGNRWGYFPSVSAGWVVSDERFFDPVDEISFLKIRASWGQNGNQSIPAFQYLSPITFTQATYNFGDEEGVKYAWRLPVEAEL